MTYKLKWNFISHEWADNMPNIALRDIIQNSLDEKSAVAPMPSQRIDSNDQTLSACIHQTVRINKIVENSE